MRSALEIVGSDMDPILHIPGGILGGGGGSPVPSSAVIKFGVLTPSGEGEQAIAAGDGTYSVGGGSFSVSSNRINVVSMPSAGVYDIDGNEVEVVAAARTVATTAEIAAMWKASAATHPTNTKILVADGTYNVWAVLSGSTYLLNDWSWEAIDPDNCPILTSTSTGQISYEPSPGSPGFSIKNIWFYREQDPVGIPWNITAYDVFTVRNSITNVRIDSCRFFGDFVAAAHGGKLTTKVCGLSLEEFTSSIVTNCEVDHLCTGVRFEGNVTCHDIVMHDMYSDFFELRAGFSGEIKRPHCYNKAGDGSLLHGDFFQMQVPPKTPTSGPILIEGGTFTPGHFWALAAGQADSAKPSSVTINTAGPTSLADVATYHGVRTIRCDVGAAGGTMEVVLPPASWRDKFTICLYQVGAGTITVTKDAGDTVEDGLTLTSNNQARSYISDGVSHYRTFTPGYRAYFQERTASQTLGEMEKDLSVFGNASSGPLSFTLPSGTTAYYVNVKKDDTSANLVSVVLPGGQTFSADGATGLTANQTLGQCGECIQIERLGGSTVWTVTEKTTTSQGIFSNGVDEWAGLTVRYNIFFVNSPRGFSPDETSGELIGIFTGSNRCYNNTFLRLAPPDNNGDGVIGPSDSWNAGTVAKIYVYPGVDTFRNVTVGDITDTYPTVRKAENIGLELIWNDPEDVSALTPYFALSSPADLRPVTRQDCIDAAIVTPAGALVVDAPSYSFIGAIGTTETNGPYNWSTGTENPNTKSPAIAAMLPTVGATGVYTNQSITITFDELISFGTGNISIREVGGAELLSYDVESASELSIGNNGLSLTINPTSDLDASTNLCVRIDSTAVVGYFNGFAGVSDDSLEFTTGTGPYSPELLLDPDFNAPIQWTAGTGGAGVFPNDGWNVSGGLASKSAGTANFRDIHTVTNSVVSPGITYRAWTVVNAVTAAAGNLRVQVKFYNGATLLSSNSTQLALSGLSPGSIVAHEEVAPVGSTAAQVLIVATDGVTAAFSVSEAHFWNVADI
jgi:hypothetical protein